MNNKYFKKSTQNDKKKNLKQQWRYITGAKEMCTQMLHEKLLPIKNNP